MLAHKCYCPAVLPLAAEIELSLSQSLSRYDIAEPKPELGSTFLSSNCVSSQTCNLSRFLSQKCNCIERFSTQWVTGQAILVHHAGSV
jgi:hypothetical protein